MQLLWRVNAFFDVFDHGEVMGYGYGSQLFTQHFEHDFFYINARLIDWVQQSSG